MADADPRAPFHEAAMPLVDEEAAWVHEAADRFEHSSAEELLAWALERFQPRMAISVAGGVDGMALMDMAWRIDPSVRVFTLDTGRLPPETYALFEEIRDRYGIEVEFEYPGTEDVTALVTREGPNLMYRSVDLRGRGIRKIDDRLLGLGIDHGLLRFAAGNEIRADQHLRVEHGLSSTCGVGCRLLR